MAKIELPQEADPYFGFTMEKTEAYIKEKPLQAGDKMLIVNLQGGLEEYVLATVVNPASGRQKRVILDRSAAWGGVSFYRSGKNCFSPTGKSRMIPPVEQVVGAIEASGNISIQTNRIYGRPIA